MRKLFFLVVASSLTLGACKTIDPYTGEEKYGATTKGAAIGAGAGAVVGAISGKDAQDRRKRALIGAGVGALAGNSCGDWRRSRRRIGRRTCRLGQRRRGKHASRQKKRTQHQHELPLFDCTNISVLHL